MKKVTSERSVIFVMGAVQFVNILDFIMVMPLGPDFSHSLGFPSSKLGLVGAGYTMAASLAGLMGAMFMDRVDRRQGLFWCLCGLFLGTVAGGFAWDLPSLMATRVFAGIFGGPASAFALAIISDVVPVERRGRAIGAVMGAFSLASVLGIPLALEAARLGGWRMPFFAVGAMGLLVGLAVFKVLPPLRGHMARAQKGLSALTFLRRREGFLSLGAQAVMMMGAFLIIPNFSAFIQFNMGYPRDRLSILYMIGGSIGFFAMRLAGRFVDAYGTNPVILCATALYVANVLASFYPAAPIMPAMATFILFMLSNSVRNVSLNTLLSKVPRSEERASFQSTQSAVTHMAAALGAVVSSAMLMEAPDHKLMGMGPVSLLSALLSGSLVLFLWGLSRMRSRAS